MVLICIDLLKVRCTAAGLEMTTIADALNVNPGNARGSLNNSLCLASPTVTIHCWQILNFLDFFAKQYKDPPVTPFWTNRPCQSERSSKARHEADSSEPAEWSERLTPGQLGWLGAAAIGSIPALALSLFLQREPTVQRLGRPFDKMRPKEWFRQIHLFACRAVTREKRKGSSSRQQTAYGAAVNKVARELLRSARSQKRENVGWRYICIKFASPIESCLCCWQLQLSPPVLPLYCSAPHCPSLSLRPGLMHSRMWLC